MKRLAWRFACAGFALLGPALALGSDADTAARFASVCAACHGADGRSTTPLVPSLAGQPSFYAITQLFLFREGRRDNARMVAIAKDLSDDDLRAFSTLIGSLPPVAAAPESPRDDRRFAHGEALVREHRCAACHGADFAGDGQVPRLAGQREDYLRLALRGFKTGQRLGYSAAMSEVLSAVATEDLDDLAHYFAHIAVRVAR